MGVYSLRRETRPALCTVTDACQVSPATNAYYTMLLRTRTLLVVLAALTVTGCDNDIVAPAHRATVQALNVTFSFDDATYTATVASEKFRIPEITPSVVDRGAVLLYFRDQGTWTALPYTLGIESQDLAVVDYTFTIGYAYDDALLEVFVEASTDDDVAWEELLSLLPTQYQMKAVIVDALNFRASEVDYGNYEAVQAYFNLSR